MATIYQSGGKLRTNKNKKQPISPYDRPANQPSLFAKLVNPASRLIYAGADRLFSVFRQPLPGTSEEPRNESQEAGPNPASNIGVGVLEPSTDEGAKIASISAAAEISDFENMLKQKTFTRSEIERLTTLLHSRTSESDIEGDRAKLPITTSQVSRLEASTSGILKERKTVNFDVPISTPITSSRAFEDDVATPAELAKAYMGTKSAKLLPLALRPSSQPSRQYSLLLNNTTVLPRTPVISLTPKPTATFKTFDSCLTTPRSQGRSALYKNARSPYYRGPSTLNQKGVASSYALEHEGSIESSRMGAKRRSSVIDDTGFGGPIRRIRQKVSLPSHQSSISKHKSEIASSQKLLLRNEPEPKLLTPLEENVETSKQKINLGFGSVPRESSRMASRIFEQLNRMSPKEKPSGSRLAGTTEKIDSPNFFSSSRDNKKSEGQHRVWLPDARASTSQVNNVFSSMNGNCTEPSSSKNTRSSVISQLTSTQKKPTVSQMFGTSTNSIGPSGVKSNISPDAKPLGSMSSINAALSSNQVKFSASIKDDSGNIQKPVNLLGKSESSSSASLTTASANGLFTFGGSTTTSSTTSGTPALSISIFASSSSYNPSGSNTDQLFSSTSSHVFSSATTTILPSTTTLATSSASTSSVAASVAPTKLFASTLATSSNGGSIFSFSSPSATLTTNGFQANTQAAFTADTQAVPFKFESGTGGTPSTTAGSSLFSSSALSFGLSSAATTSSTSSLFSSGLSSTPNIDLSSTVASTESKSGSSASGSTASIFGSTALQPPESSLFGSTPFSFGASSSSAAGTTQTPSPSSPAFGQDSGGKPGFVFGSGTPSTVPFQFGGQTNQPQTPSQNPFQASAGSFSLGSGGSVKSDRRILKVKRLNRRK
ncbi:uncharacterized protein LOC143576314 [Bidens hawaiensis]|uniref:uncharacterized protein LOC143544125 n=1 Tax=Bidens hawaiensis TaxID=980011 RepID=UPI0040491BCD